VGSAKKTFLGIGLTPTNSLLLRVDTRRDFTPREGASKGESSKEDSLSAHLRCGILRNRGKEGSEVRESPRWKPKREPYPRGKNSLLELVAKEKILSRCDVGGCRTNLPGDVQAQSKGGGRSGSSSSTLRFTRTKRTFQREKPSRSTSRGFERGSLSRKRRSREGVKTDGVRDEGGDLC